MIHAYYCGGPSSFAMALLILRGQVKQPAYLYRIRSALSMRWEDDYFRNELSLDLSAMGINVIEIESTGFNEPMLDEDGMILMPVLTQTGPRQPRCSVEWRQRIVETRIRRIDTSKSPILLLPKPYEENSLRSYGEPTARFGMKFEFPLNEIGMTETDCIDCVRAAGHGTPGAARCSCCPLQSTSEWQESMIQDRYSYARISSMEDAVTKLLPRQAGCFISTEKAFGQKAISSVSTKRRLSSSVGFCFM